MALERCPCGRPLHYPSVAQRRAVEQLNAVEGAEVLVRAGDRTWLVPRHYLHLHGPAKLDEMNFAEILSDGFYLPFKHDTGGAVLPAGRPDPTKQVFEHIDTDGVQRHFFIPKLQQMVDQKVDGLRLVEFEISQDGVDFVMNNRGIDGEHAAQRLSDADLERPGLMCEWPDGSQLIADGNHRYVARFLRGKPFMAFWMFPEPLWRKSLLAWVSALSAI